MITDGYFPCHLRVFINNSHLPAPPLLDMSCIMAVSDEESINLLNFEQPRFRESRYVLTSPRSLRACANLGLKVQFCPVLSMTDFIFVILQPLELLHQSFQDYSASEQGRLFCQGSHLATAYENYEKERRSE